MWAERAGVPVCSRYVQAYVDLLSSIRYSMVSDSHLLLEDKIAMDAATPLPMEGQTKSEKCGNSSVSISHKSWEWDEGWISCDAGWEVDRKHRVYGSRLDSISLCRPLTYGWWGRTSHAS